jgi:hypothetical protein
VIGGLGNGFGYSTPIPVMAKRFPDKRGLAIAFEANFLASSLHDAGEIRSRSEFVRTA